MKRWRIIYFVKGRGYRITVKAENITLALAMAIQRTSRYKNAEIHSVSIASWEE